MGVFVSQNAKGQVRVGVTGAAPKAFRASDPEVALSKDFSAKAIAGIKVFAKSLLSDIHATSAYRAHLASVLAGRAVAWINKHRKPGRISVPCGKPHGLFC